MPAEAQENFSGKHLVVFGCGDIGGQVAREALTRGLRVTALTRNPAKAAGLRALGLATVVADLAAPGWHDQIAARPDFVLNTVSSGGAGLDGYRRSYFEGMRSVLAWTAAHDFSGPLVYTGSTAVYPQDDGACLDETAAVLGRDERAAILVETENLLLSPNTAGDSGPGRVFVLRLAGIYGPGRHYLLDQVRAGEVSGHGGQHLNLVHRDDVSSAIWAVLGAPTTVTERVFNVADDGAATKAEVVAWLAARLEVAMPRFTGCPAGGRRTLTPDRIIGNGRLKAVLGWRPRFPTFREGYATLLSR